MTTHIGLTKEALDKCVKTPGLFSSFFLGSPAKTKYQADSFNAMMTEKYVAIKSANGLGKTFLLSDAVLEALYVLGYAAGGSCFIIATGPTFNIVKNVLFSEIRLKHNTARVSLGGDLNLTQLKLADKWELIGFSPSKSGQGDPSNFKGFHANLVIIVFEEATGVPRSIWDMARTMTSSENVKMWAIGNPTDGSAAFADCFTSYKWRTFSWPCFVSPNLQANNIKNLKDIEAEVLAVKALPTDDKRRDRIASYKVVVPHLLTLQFVIEMAIDWGIDSPLFQSSLLAEFPSGGVGSDISIDRASACMDEAAEAEGIVKHIPGELLSIGVDVARFGDDSTVIKTLDFNKEIKTEIINKQETTYIVARIKQTAAEMLDLYKKDIMIGVDATGIGAGVFDMLNGDYALVNSGHYTLYEQNFGNKAVDSKRYANLVSEARRTLAEQIKSEAGFIMQKDHILLNELVNRKHRYDNKSRYWIESKDDYKARTGGRSCDRADALKIAFYNYVLHKRGSVLYNVATDKKATSYSQGEW